MIDIEVVHTVGAKGILVHEPGNKYHVEKEMEDSEEKPTTAPTLPWTLRNGPSGSFRALPGMCDPALCCASRALTRLLRQVPLLRGARTIAAVRNLVRVDLQLPIGDDISNDGPAEIRFPQGSRNLEVLHDRTKNIRNTILCVLELQLG